MSRADGGLFRSVRTWTFEPDVSRSTVCGPVSESSIEAQASTIDARWCPAKSTRRVEMASIAWVRVPQRSAFAMMERNVNCWMGRLPAMPGTTRPLPERYPDAEKVGRFRLKDLEIFGLRIRMTITPGETTVALWELEEGHPSMWISTVFRIDAEPPVIRVSHKYEDRLTWPQRHTLARLASEFWMS
ncbi:hypothetical protein K3N28_05965 [Glycomyces sp. TRM65418]|uniref:hypothetical protein n=1 Tax=Glycomyces sp. TRM65418 TaxID=2867006 RepID=UPI001CE4E3EA|nr:hypothetical protein [Glycomyces sp. TRM65418]MCC3762615.1 hypothetical protein [Glycomyces sp. TRM65418]QZD56653.1 hypothetical protein K3N28_05925 [Glycomyces sp. TRM65418]